PDLQLVLPELCLEIRVQLVRNAVPLPLGLGQRLLVRSLTGESAADLLSQCIKVADRTGDRQFRIAVLDTFLGVRDIVRQLRPLRHPICGIGIMALAESIEASESRDVEIT